MGTSALISGARVLPEVGSAVTETTLAAVENLLQGQGLGAAWFLLTISLGEVSGRKPP